VYVADMENPVSVNASSAHAASRTVLDPVIVCAHVLVHGREYFRRLYAVLCELQRDEWIHFTDWRGDPDERLDGSGSEVARVLAECARRGVHVRGLVWRSHPDQAHFSEQENLHLVETVNDAGGEVLLDERVRHAGSHHQKLFVVRRPNRPDDDVTFVGGIDLCPVATTPKVTKVIPSPWRSTRATDPGPRGTTCSSRCTAPPSETWRSRLLERWEDPTPSTTATPCRRLPLRRWHTSPSGPTRCRRCLATRRRAVAARCKVVRTYPAVGRPIR
jgi:phosphatidylserine/phosphatidylglycerophosphate/cardiolipin synthase-like enzyme